MGRKKPFAIFAILISILISACTRINVSAIGPSSWTFEEMSVFSHQIEELKEAYCEEHPNPYMPEMCYYEYQWDGEDQDKYNATSAYNMNGLIITAINPSKKSFRIYFKSIELGYKRIGFAPSDYTHDLASLYIAQFDNGYPMGSYWEDIENGVVDPHRHTIYAGTAKSNGDHWIPSDEEVELPIGDISVNPESSRHIQINYKTTLGISYGIYYDLSECLDSPNYREGMECQIRYRNSDNMIFFVPAEPVDIVVNSLDDNTPIDDKENQPDINIDQENSFLIPVSVIDEPELTKSDTGMVVKAPETGVNTNETCIKTIEFPWWLIPILVLGDIILLWWFSPIHRRK